MSRFGFIPIERVALRGHASLAVIQARLQKELASGDGLLPGWTTRRDQRLVGDIDGLRVHVLLNRLSANSWRPILSAECKEIPTGVELSGFLGIALAPTLLLVPFTAIVVLTRGYLLLAPAVLILLLCFRAYRSERRVLLAILQSVLE